MNLIKLSTSRITAALLALCMAFGLCGCNKPEREDSMISASPEVTQAKAEPTTEPTDEPTEEPAITEDPWTKEKRFREDLRSSMLEGLEYATLPLQTSNEWQSLDHLSRVLLEKGRDYVSKYELPCILMDDGVVHFEITDEAMIVYDWMDNEYDYEKEEYVYIFNNPMFLLPRELGIRAKQSLIDFYNKYDSWDSLPVEDDPEDVDIQMSGIMGENYIIFRDQLLGGRNHVGIFMTEDGENWKEIKCEEPYLVYRLTGGTVRSDKEAYMCIWNKEDDQLGVYRTTDGGETWKKLDLVVPERDGIQIYMSYAINPVFDGDHGIIVTCYRFMDPVNEDTMYEALGWFETKDGGETWEFVDSGMLYDPQIAY